MAKLVFGLNQSLDGYVDHQEFSHGRSPSSSDVGGHKAVIGTCSGPCEGSDPALYPSDRPALRSFSVTRGDELNVLLSRALLLAARQIEAQV